MANEEMLETTNETENTETETVEETQEGIELTDTAETEETIEEPVEEREEVEKSLRDILRENPKYQKELEDTIIKPRLNRKDKEYQRELSKYKDTENVLKKTLEVQDGEDVNTKLREFYKDQGIELPEVYHQGLTENQIRRLAIGEAEDIIAEGYDAMVDEANRLAKKEYKNLSESEKIIFNTLAEKLTEENDKQELKKLGAKEELLKDENFNSFRKKFNSNVPMEEIYSLYKGSQPKPKVENPGSMKSQSDTSNVKDFYTREEALKFTKEDLDKNPKLVKAIEDSMIKW